MQLCVTLSVVCPHYRFGVIVCPRVYWCSPAQREASGDIYALTETTNSQCKVAAPHTSSSGL